MANRTRYPRDPEKYPEEDKYPEIMSKMDPLIIRVSPTVLLVGSTTYTAKIKLGYRFNGFNVNVTGVGIPIYTEEVDIGNASTTNKSAKNGMSDAYNKVEEQATRWMDDLEKSMLDDSKEKNIVDLLREIKYQMHFDMSGHKASATVEGSPDYDPRIEVCNDVPTYIEDLYAMLLKISIRLDNLTAVINGGDLKELKNDSVVYNQVDSKFDYDEITVQSNVNGLNQLIEGLNTRIGDTADGTVISKLTTIGTNVSTVATKVDTVATKVDTVATKVDTVANKVDLVASNSTTNATTISNAITNGLNQLVAQMNAMNGKIGTSSDTEANDTLFGYINKTKSAPIISMDSDHVDYLKYWGQDLYKGNNDGTKYEYLIGAIKKFFTKNDTCTANKLDYALINGASGIDYHSLQGFGGWTQSWSIRVYMGTWHN